MSKRVCVIDLPGLSRELLSDVPPASALGRWLTSQPVCALKPSWPAVTCPVQATLTTGVQPARHGIVSNGLATFRSAHDQRLVDPGSFADYRRAVSFWEQSNQLVQAPRFWQDPNTGSSRVKTALLFFQQSMPGFVDPFRPAADIVVTPKPEHGSDGKITSLLWTEPHDLVGKLFAALGPFPLMKYWGPLAGIESSQWIARCGAWVWRTQSPRLQLVYVPHLDYDLQRHGPQSPQARKAVVELTGAVEPLIENVLSDDNASLVVISEYSMRAVDRCVHPNRVLADAGLLLKRDTRDGKLIDYERSGAFAMVDHQVAHVYAKDRAAADRAREVFSKDASVELLDRTTACPHPRAGDLLLQSSPDAWFDYRWWHHEADAPVFAKDVDIHRKPGYDPLELFFDPGIGGISQEAARVRGSHGHGATSDGLLIGVTPPDDSSVIAASEVSAQLIEMLR
jgi:predicted AlkP superfamily pyrophosphatase or phosphodiesterase